MGKSPTGSFAEAIEALRAEVHAVESARREARAETDTFFLLFCGSLVFIMQAGFALLAAGSVRMRSVKNILLKSVMDACLGGLIWYLFGFGLAYDDGDGPGNPFIGSSSFNFALSGVDDSAGDDNGTHWIKFFFQYAFAAAAATITSGAVAERCTLVAYLLYVVLIVGFIYPVIVHWVWDPAGFLSAFNKDAVLTGMIDFAGSGVVHMTGGVCALSGAAIIAPRRGRFHPQSDCSGAGLDQPGTGAFQGQSAPLQVLGTFLLWFGWYGFNPGSTLAIHGYARDAARAAVTTTLAAAAAATAGLLLKRGLPGRLGGSLVWDLGHSCNSLLGGLVSITAGCSVVAPWASILIGALGAAVYHAASCSMRKLKIDDPLDAFAVHGACGLWGCVAVGFFCTPAYSYAPHADSQLYSTLGGYDCGVLYGGSGQLLAAQIVSPLLIALWAGSLSAIAFAGMRTAKMLRVSEYTERIGLDNTKHGGGAYPAIDAAIDAAIKEVSSSLKKDLREPSAHKMKEDTAPGAQSTDTSPAWTSPALSCSDGIAAPPPIAAEGWERQARSKRHPSRDLGPTGEDSSNTASA